LSTLSTIELTRVSHALARALAVDEVNQLGRDTGQAERLRIVTPHRLFLAIVSALASAPVESLADLLRAFNYQHGVEVAYKAFYNRLARVGFATFMRGMLARLIERLSLHCARRRQSSRRISIRPSPTTDGNQMRERTTAPRGTRRGPPVPRP